MVREYRITYKPYIKTTTVERYYSASDEWTPIGVKDEKDIKYVLDRKEIIQKSGYELLLQLDKYNKEIDDSSFVIRFIGLEQDYLDFERIASAFKKNVADTKFDKVVSDGFLPNPVQIIEEIESSWDNIINLYNGEFDEVKHELEKVMKERTEALNVSELTVLVVGMQNSGKSTLINSLLGRNLLPISSDVETAALFTVREKEENYIEVKTEDDNVKIEISDTEYKYSNAPKWLKDIIDKLCHKIDSKSADERICELLKGINDACKSSQNGDSTIPFIKEIEIGVKNFSANKSAYKYCIKDLPGAGASGKFLGEEHKKIIFETISDIANAVTIYVIKADSLNDDSAQTFLEEIKQKGSSSGGTQQARIDFERSIYVLNKADSTNDSKEDIKRKIERYPEYRGSKWVSTSAEASLEIQTSEKIRPEYIVKFVTPMEGYEPTDLTKRSCLPHSYTDEMVDKMISNVITGTNKSEALVRTGTPLVLALINDYAVNAFAVHKVNCLYDVVNGVGRILEKEENEQLKKCEQMQQELEKKKNDIRNDVKNKIRAEQRKSADEIANSSKLSSSLHSQMAGMLNRFCNNIKDSWKVEAKKSKLGKKREKLNELINNAVKNEARPFAINVSNTIKNNAIDEYKKRLKDKLNEQTRSNAHITVDDIEEVVRSIDDFSPTPFEAKFTYKGIRLAGTKKVDKFNEFWSEAFIARIIEDLARDIKSDIDKLTKAVESQIDKLSPAMRANQAEIDKEKEKQELLKKKREQSGEIRNVCKKLYEEGARVDV